ncbi:hypothetical protein PTE01_02330 [Pseudoalteromonas tetraodonis GFC]|uniref:Uncharacterized protein n=1 Tax=Pseudoalteromonas tetraodonis GFC TaxID=1315271 RepID=A0AA37S4S4_9GAMM|nr:hypothetical protein [Pseudoalteromonas tetraodonis]ATD03219.1 hypothetical protein PTET_a1823 [Pseudoalteromonas tetraodonis]GEN37123.1 hypothetical protein PTE01_02330 [Pseudoalteromonas tetraodonis GFC]GLQ02994.1 hypothetical protein GCM10007914_18750 [Pseudoalteromonas tetraodonis GFC]|tara:strand:- start:143 stop:268 length:126 start_codon:yes stop_codon:yes gene_type:complete
MTNQFNFEDAVKALQSGKKLNGKNQMGSNLDFRHQTHVAAL